MDCLYYAVAVIAAAGNNVDRFLTESVIKNSREYLMFFCDCLSHFGCVVDVLLVKNIIKIAVSPTY